MKVLTEESNFTDIGDAIRAKNGESTLYKPGEMAAAIGRISGGGYPEPTGTITITTNGTHNVKDYASAQVNVQPNLQSKTATQNGTVAPDAGYDGLSSVVVDVSGGGGGEPTLPAEYQEVEYIESTGTQYTTPMVLTLPSKSLISIRFARMSGTNEQAAFGAHSNSSLSSGTLEIGIASGASSSGVTVWTGGTLWKSYEAGTTGNPCSAVASVTNNLNSNYITLCKYKTYMLNGRLYSCAIYKLKDTPASSNPYELMFKAVPCYRKSDGVIGFYEVVSGTFLTNAGTGSFGKGPDV